ncbi:hypothetical protein A6R71_04465 [Xanthomonas translucens pv. arrhenatheri]|nr:hypothetical protein A6R71_04465 [Xanthomonas translucens pv. arrhenatheri]
MRQSYVRQGPALSRKAGRYAHACQFKRMRRVLRRQRTVLGRVLRDIERKLDQVESGVRERIRCNCIERCFARLKQFRRIAARFDRKPAQLLALLYLASIPLWWP